MPESQNSFEKDYLGFARHGVDDKRRLQIPSRWRPDDENFELTMVIWTAHEAGPCLRVLPPPQMRELREKLINMSGDDPAKEEMVHFIGVNSEKVPVDKSGRVCVPERMAQAAGIENEAVMVGLINKFEIWSPGRYALHAERFGAPRREFFNIIK
jgi:MraZ protein